MAQNEVKVSVCRQLFVPCFGNCLKAQGGTQLRGFGGAKAKAKGFRKNTKTKRNWDVT